MPLSILASWFPIILGVGVGTRGIGRALGFIVGLIACLFWIVLVHVSHGGVIWQQPWGFASVLACTLAIVAMGGWSGDRQENEETEQDDELTFRFDRKDADIGKKTTRAIRLFNDWLERHRQEQNPWPEFDSFIRGVLMEFCGLKQVIACRVRNNCTDFVPLNSTHGHANAVFHRSVDETMRRVALSGEPHFEENSARKGKQSVDVGVGPVSWCFPIRIGGNCVGVVAAGPIPSGLVRPRLARESAYRLINQFWGTLQATVDSQNARRLDAASGLLTRSAFLTSAESSIESTESESVCAAVIAIEGMRELNDAGAWSTADKLIRETGKVMLAKARSSDLLGRFDGSRFVMFLQRADARLAVLIAAQVMGRLNSLCASQQARHPSLAVRCGLVVNRDASDAVHGLIAGALVACGRARIQGIQIVQEGKIENVEPEHVS